MSSDLQFAPLTQALVRTLTDKLYEKRKAAALEIEKQVKELVKTGNYAELDKLVGVLESLTLTPNANTRKGGLIGLAATSIALGKNCGPYTSRLMEPVFCCFTDADSRVRYFACESLYNIVKICRSTALEKFTDLFDVLWKLASDTDQNVRSGSELLDRLVKEIVVGTQNFDLEFLMVLIRERIYNVNSSNRRFIISWLHTVLTVPVFSIATYIPEVVDGVFKALEDPAPAVRDATIAVLSELLHKLDPKVEEETNIGGIINVLVGYTGNSTEPIARETAITSIELNKRLMELTKSDTGNLVPVESTVEVLLVHLRHANATCRVATLNWIRYLHSVHPNNMFDQMDRFFPVLLELLSDPVDEVLMLDIMLITDICGQPKQNLDIKSLNLADEVNQELKTISPYLIKFNVSLLKMFKNDSRLVAERGIQIVRQVCLLLNPIDVYRSLALLLSSSVSLDSNASSLSRRESVKCEDLENSDMEFVARMVAMLNQILLTTCELFHLRQCLKNPEANVLTRRDILLLTTLLQDCVDLFERLYRCWCHQPICLISLCLLSQNYFHAVDLVHRLSEIDITVDLLTEIDHLVQLIESPILAYVRMDLLNADCQKPLAAVLSALLMLLPQTDAFTTLHKRNTSSKKASKSGSSKIKFKELLSYFEKITQHRTQEIRRRHRLRLDVLAKQK
ncbi:vacuolar 14 fab1-binding region domain-containing protein [Ditylenchus destructor]|uniref:Protein VAC14 homolog n=1 Tax=Ditylenchus destructor TaxID=166010 RepID=A0AAD4NID8_9BILA|nr:vacuolar 14 fab1-binding region domain-containing protein [Ditylenchus destructor]